MKNKSNEEVNADVVIIGAGPVGLFSVFSCAMMGLSCHVIETLPVIGGQCRMLYPEKPIHNLPGFPVISGKELIDKLQAQIESYAPVFHMEETVVNLQKKREYWSLTTNKQKEILTKSVMITTGGGAFVPRGLPVENAALFEGKSLFYSVIDKQIFADSKLVITGGGDPAVDWALVLCEIAGHITIVHRRNQFRAYPGNLKRLEEKISEGKITLLTPYQIKTLEGTEEGQIHALTISSVSGEKKKLEADKVLAFFGMKTNLMPFEEWGIFIEKGKIRINSQTGETNLPGIYAAGDAVAYANKQPLLLSGFSEALQSASSIYRYLSSNKKE